MTDYKTAADILRVYAPFAAFDNHRDAYDAAIALCEAAAGPVGPENEREQCRQIALDLYTAPESEMTDEIERARARARAQGYAAGVLAEAVHVTAAQDKSDEWKAKYDCLVLALSDIATSKGCSSEMRDLALDALEEA